MDNGNSEVYIGCMWLPLKTVFLRDAGLPDHFLSQAILAGGITIITGPVTDNLVGIQFIQNTMGIRAVNAVSDPNKLGDWVAESAFMLPASSTDEFKI